MGARGIHHVDLAAADVGASPAFYRDLLGPLGLAEELRYPGYRGTEEVVCLVDGRACAHPSRSCRVVKDDVARRPLELVPRHLLTRTEASSRVGKTAAGATVAA